MKLMTKVIAAQLRKADKLFRDRKDGTTSDEIVVKYFNPCGAATWWIVQGTPVDSEGGPDYETDSPDDWHLYGFANLGDDRCAECGYTMLSDLENLKLPMGLTIERDLHPIDTSLKQVIAETRARA